MKITPRQALRQLIKHSGRMLESEAFSYDDFKKYTDTLLEKGFNDIKRLGLSKNNVIFQIYTKVKNYLKKFSPPIKYVQQGSSRVVFALDGGRCLKVAQYENGLKQMKREAQAYIKGEGYACFPRLYEYDDKWNYSLVTDFCADATQADFIQTYGLDCSCIVGTVYELVEARLDFSKVKDYFERCLADKLLGEEDPWENFEKRIQFIDNLEKNKDHDVRWQSIWDLARFSYDNNADLDDLEFTVNWGLINKEGKECPVVIDAGLMLA